MSQTPPKPYRVTHAAITDVGMRRETNQDALLVAVDSAGEQRDRGHFFMVADGMGAHAAGELASKIAVDNVGHTYRKHRDTPPPAALREAVQRANRQIHDKGQSSAEFHGMGTTCSCLALLPGTALVAHVGDSRVYRARGGTLEQLTFDHSLVWEMAAASHVSADQVPGCIPKNVITRSLGPHEAVNVDLEGPFPVEAGDTFLLCSDGLSGVVADDEIGALMGTLPPDEAVETLVDLANLRGGPDNITVIVVRVEPCETEPPPPEEPPSKLGRVHALSWLGMAGCLVAVVVFGAYRYPLGALMAAAGFGASLVIALMQHATPPAARHEGALGGPYGNGPHRRFDCLRGEAAAAKLIAVVQQIADTESLVSENGSGETIDWAPFQASRSEANASHDRGDHAAALRHAGLAIRQLMRQLRERGKGGDSILPASS